MEHQPSINAAIVGLTKRLRTYRIIYTIMRGVEMPLIEIKGLKESVAGAKKGIADIRTAAASLNTETAQLVAEVNDLTAQVKQHRDDLKFEASTLGNSTSEEETKVNPNDVNPHPKVGN